MRISATVIAILISTYIVGASVLDPVIENVVHLQASKPPKGVGGMWKKKTVWKPRWIKEWKSAKVMKPVWKKIWSPVQIREWVPIPKPPPGWDSISTPLALIHPKPKAPLRESVGYGLLSVRATSNTPLWDPIPYPESQQPPPPPLYTDNAHSATFNEEQISGIIGPRYNTHEYSQEYSETVNHITRLPLANTWRPPQPLPEFQNFPPLPEFLIPPQYQTLIENNPRRQEQHNRLAVGVQKSFGNWVTVPQENKSKAPDAPYGFQQPQTLKNDTNKTQNGRNGLHHHADGDFIQEAALVGEYHFSEFDLTEKPQVKENKQNQQNPQPVPDKELRQTRTEHEKTITKPVYTENENHNLFFIPPNHRFAPLNNDTPKNTSMKLHPLPPLEQKNTSLQIVYPTAPQTASDALFKTYNYNATAEDLQTTTVKPTTLVFPSSLEEEIAKSPVYVVTPAKTDSS